MSARDENCHSDEHRASLTRLPQLAEPNDPVQCGQRIGTTPSCRGLGSDQRPQFEDPGKICGLPNRVGFNEGKHPHGSTPGRGQDFDSVSGRKTSHTSSRCTKSRDGSRRFLGAGLRDSSRCGGSGGERISANHLLAASARSGDKVVRKLFLFYLKPGVPDGPRLAGLLGKTLMFGGVRAWTSPRS